MSSNEQIDIVKLRDTLRVEHLGYYLSNSQHTGTAVESHANDQQSFFSALTLKS